MLPELNEEKEILLRIWGRIERSVVCLLAADILLSVVKLVELLGHVSLRTNAERKVPQGNRRASFYAQNGKCGTY